MSRHLDVHVFKLTRGCSDRFDHSSHCIRGLEWYLSCEENKRILIRKADAIKAVMDEQDRQRQEGISDPYNIAFASSQMTYLGRIEARLRANQDAVDNENSDQQLNYSESPRSAKKAKRGPLEDETSTAATATSKTSPPPSTSFLAMLTTMVEQLVDSSWHESIVNF